MACDKNVIKVRALVGWQRVVIFLNSNVPSSSGGGGGIRTPETLSSLTVFKTAGFNRSPTPPFPILR